MRTRHLAIPSLAALASLLLSCAGTMPDDLGTIGGELATCPDSPNCVSSDTNELEDPSHYVAPFELAVGGVEAWAAARAAVMALPRTAIIQQTDDYLHAECTSAIFRYVDDLELHLRSAEGIIAVRSASRVGYGDAGVNRARVEELRALLVEEGVIQ